MPPYRLLKHHEYDQSAHRLPSTIQNKALWAQVLLGIRGRTPTVKGVKGYNQRWRRTPVQGNHFYLWWIPRSEGNEIAGWQQNSENDKNTILVHSIRHHDETDEPLDMGAPDDYEEVALPALEPRFAEQLEVSKRVSGDLVTLTTVKGLPGSGKTVSLLYLVKDLATRGDLRKILYITYTSRLKRMAKEFFDALGEPVSKRVSLRTLGELEAEIAGTQLRGEPFAELEDFSRFLDAQNPSSLGSWRKYPATFYTELRAHLLGRSFPPDYKLGNGKNKFDSIFRRSPLQNPNIYAKERDLDQQLATIALRVLERTQGRFFGDQRAALRALHLADQDKLPRWLTEIDGLVLDEVQDLTLLQIALLGEIGRARLRKDDYNPFSFIVAGDESQIVQPSGFDWGTTKDLLGEQIGLYPEEFEFEHQRRAPRNLAHLIDATWNLYLLLPKQLRPSAKRQSFIYEDSNDSTSEEEVGRILLCPLPEAREANIRWGELLVELGDKPGRAVVDLSEQLTKGLRVSHEEASSDQGEETIFLAREIKGLERSTVIIHGLNDVYLRARRLIESNDGQQLALLEARRIFDEIRVALSRSTDRLVILDAVESPVFSELGLKNLQGVAPLTWNELLELLSNEEMSDVELIEGILSEADDLVERGRWEQAYRQNRRAYALALQINDSALQREAQEEYIRTHLYEADYWFEHNEWAKADQVNQEALQLAQDYGDPFLLEEVEDQRKEIDGSLTYQAQNRIAAAKDARQQKQFKRSYNELRNALAIAQSAGDAALQQQVDDLLVEVALSWANDLHANQGTADQFTELYTATADALSRQQDAQGAQIVSILAQRYHDIPQIGSLAPAQIKDLLAALQHYLAAISRPAILNRKLTEETFNVAQLWIEESFTSLGRTCELYVNWALAAIEFAQKINYSELDNRLWELDLRVQELLQTQLSSEESAALAHFRAVSAAYSGDPVEASRAWEELGEIGLAVEQARLAGDLERAYTLLRHNKNEIPEELSTAVKTLRLLQQLEQKHHGLNDAERQTLLEALARLHVILSTDKDENLQS
ncbi:MAG: AAA family ATPase [Caldilineaceae bacterium]